MIDKRLFYENFATNILLSAILCLIIYLNLLLYSKITQTFINIKIWIIFVIFIILIIVSFIDAMKNSKIQEQPKYQFTQ